ncbi:putative colanic acid biosynthesis acetyltransferase [Collimonas antrihumi]|uniref:putative colanic acid biosynthesis acetyltransferase n=1 Tax=Collimonas antrihumi TaxID=1940615 RepID=UPI002484B1C1|nr:putative colanic acid biosynthesis acetyltransferase [Collimonas antrihumi]
MMQDLSRFKLPPNFRGRSAFAVQLWWFVQAIFFHTSPQFAYGFRRWLLRCFGAQVGKHTVIRPSVTVTYPWKVKIGDHAWIGDNVVLYSLGEIDIGPHAVVSQSSYLCAADHDYAQVDFPIRARKITIGEQAWVAADVFIAPGVTIGAGAVIGARSSVFRDMPAGMVCLGYPAKPVKPRVKEKAIS